VSASKPRRRFELTLRVGGDDWPAVLSLLGELLDHLEERGAAADCVTGGPDHGGFVKVEESPEQTHEKYFSDIEALRAAEKASRP
jgi:hypothetical protein